MSADLMTEHVYDEMVKAQTEQGFAMFREKQFDVAIAHYEEAIKQIKEFRDIDAQAEQFPEPQQPPLDI